MLRGLCRLRRRVGISAVGATAGYAVVIAVVRLLEALLQVCRQASFLSLAGAVERNLGICKSRGTGLPARGGLCQPHRADIGTAW